MLETGRSARDFVRGSVESEDSEAGAMSISTRDTVDGLADVRNLADGVDRLDAADVVDKSLSLIHI